MTIPPHFDLNKETAERAPDEHGTVFIFDSKKNKGSETWNVPNIKEHLLKLLGNDPNPIGKKVGWNEGEDMETVTVE